MSNTNEQEVNKWRDKYLLLADEQDAFKKTSQEQQQLLKRAVLMMSLLAEGQSSSLDEHIQQVRASAKKSDNLVKPLSELEKSVKGFEKNQAQQSQALNRLLQSAADELLNCELSSRIKMQIKEVRGQVKRDIGQYEGYINQLNLWVNLLNTIAEEHLEKSTSIGDKLKNLFNKEETETQEEPEVNISSPSVEATENLSSVLTETAQNKDMTHITRAIKKIITRLLAQLILSDNAKPLAQALKLRLQQTVNWQDVPALLQDAAQLILQHITGTQKEVKDYLEQLDERLAVLYQLLNSADDEHTQRRLGRDEFHHSMSSQVADIQTIVQGSGELGELSERIMTHLSLLTKTLEKFKQEEIQSEQNLKGQLNSLKNKVTEMEAEAAKVREQMVEHHHKATHDALTGMPNRQAYNERIEAEYQRYKRYQNPLSLIIADVDFFKKINDNYGHLAGDKMLQLIARMLQKNIRDVDFIARIGGEEFTILLPETDGEHALVLAEKIRQKVAQTPFHYKEQRIPVSMSFGVSSFNESDLIQEVFERADKALYSAKESGRNNCKLIN